MGFWSRLWKALTTAAVTPAPAVEVVSVNHLDTVIAERAKYGTPLGYENAWKVINAVALRHASEGWGLVDKPSGTNWAGYSCDVLLNKDGTAVDCLGDSEGAGKPCWNVLDPADAPIVSRWRAPVAQITPVPEPVPDPTPTPDPIPIPLSPVLARLEAAITAFCKSWLGV